MYAVRREISCLILLSGGQPHQKLNPFINLRNRINMEQTVLHRLHHLILQHQILHIGNRNNYPLCPRQTAFSAKVEEPFDFMGHTADCLNFALLVDRTRHRQILTNRQFRQGGKNAV